jgi:hypothetical protein
MLERLAMDKHSNLLKIFVNYFRNFLHYWVQAVEYDPFNNKDSECDHVNKT